MTTGLAESGRAASAGLAAITPVVLTYDEAPNIDRCLSRLSWASRVVVLDSGSSDGTAAIARRHPNVDLHVRPFDDHVHQWNHGISLVKTPWVLSLDADYVVPESFVLEAPPVVADPGIDAAFARFRYCIFGRPLRSSLYPPRAVLFRRDRCSYEEDGHTQRLRVPGRCVTLASSFDHDDRKPFSRWLQSQRRYSRLEAEKLAAGRERLLPADRIRRTIVLGPPAAFVYTFIVKAAVLDGWPGWYYTLQRTIAESMLSFQLVARSLRRS